MIVDDVLECEGESVREYEKEGERERKCVRDWTRICDWSLETHGDLKSDRHNRQPLLETLNRSPLLGGRWLMW